jgi:hypothetical protein
LVEALRCVITITNRKLLLNQIYDWKNILLAASAILIASAIQPTDRIIATLIPNNAISVISYAFAITNLISVVLSYGNVLEQINGRSTFSLIPSLLYIILSATIYIIYSHPLTQSLFLLSFWVPITYMSLHYNAIIIRDCRYDVLLASSFIALVVNALLDLIFLPFGVAGIIISSILMQSVYMLILWHQTTREYTICRVT